MSQTFVVKTEDDSACDVTEYADGLVSPKLFNIKNESDCNPHDRKPAPYPCSVGDKRFTKKNRFAHHQKIHTEENVYSCAVCDGKRFSSPTSLIHHMNIHKRKYQCSDCGRCFGTSNDLERHGTSHSGEKAHECAACGKRFAHARSLAVHGRIHSGHKPYRCHVCEAAFTQSNSLSRHMSVHFRRAKPHRCLDCGKSFATRTKLKRHGQTHSAASCEHCSESFERRGQLSIHLLESHGEGDWFTCYLCRRKFSRSHSLQAHIKRKVCLRQPKCSEQFGVQQPN